MVSAATNSFRSGAVNIDTWFLFIAYACSFGVELTMNNAAALYFNEIFGQSVESAAAIASIFDFMNLFARGLGGFSSDKLDDKLGLRGRLVFQTIFMAMSGALIIIFGRVSDLAGAIALMSIFSVLVQAAEGSTYAIVPYADPQNAGSVSGIVGAGGNVGAVVFGFIFRNMSYTQSFEIVGAVVMGMCILPLFITIKGHKGIFCGKDTRTTVDQINLDMYANQNKDSVFGNQVVHDAGEGSDALGADEVNIIQTRTRRKRASGVRDWKRRCRTKRAAERCV